tara:strand:+ start:3774 stop:6092 length:2319 start_codon:yes stop_codon:yes gene_type:complete
VAKIHKEAQRVQDIFDLANGESRSQWEYVNQKGFDFANDNQLTDEERKALEEQGMPTFTINRIAPVVEMLNFYATANNPRWQAIGAEGSDADVAAVFSDLSDYIWNLSDADSLYGNCVNDAITKGVGFLQVSVDPDSDNGMGDVKILQPEPFDIYIDPKARDLLFRDASFMIIRKVLPKSHLKKLFPEHARKINSASGSYQDEMDYSEASNDNLKKDFHYKDISDGESVNVNGENDEIVEFFELFEKIKIAYVNVYYNIPPDEAMMQNIQKRVEEALNDLAEQLQVELKEKMMQLQQAMQSGQMIQERFDLESKNLQKDTQNQLAQAENDLKQKMIADASQIGNKVVTEKEFVILAENEEFANSVVDSVKFYGTRIQQTCVCSDKLLYKTVLPEKITEYPIVPFHYKWTGTPYPMSAVSPLIGKQREINKAHQIMVHNASLGSSLRWMYEEGSVDTDYWEKYSSSPGALLPVRPGAAPPTVVQPAPLSSSFFGIVQEGKQDMEYLAGIYSSMQGDTGSQHETFRGMLALDEYGTRRIKQWMQNSIEPALRQLGRLVMMYSQSVYSAHKTFRIIQPSALQEEREAQINIPMYNDMGEAIGKAMDIQNANFDIRIVSGSTLPINRWAYLAELKELMQLGVVDDIAVLAETDLRNKEKIAERKSMLAQMQSQVASMEEAIQDKDGTIETLERQLVQAGIKGKVMQAEMEITKKREQVKAGTTKELLETQAKQKLLRQFMQNEAQTKGKELGMEVDSAIEKIQETEKELQSSDNEE